jgi:serine/threonine-protein kinase
LAGRYVLDDVLGTGGMSVVWRGRDQVLDRQVAVKLLSGRYAADPLWSRRIRAEARAAAALSHPNVAQVYDFGETEAETEADGDGGPVPFVVMELIDGRTLEDRMLAGPVPARAAMRLGAEVAAALAAAHTRGLVHRDIKPANIMITPLGAKVVDFGIAASVSPHGSDLDDELFGTPAYIAPERLTSEAVEPASDVYSLGVLLYRLLAGRTPFPKTATTGILDAHLHVDPAPLPPITDVPDPVAGLCLRCLAKRPADRPTARQVAIALADAAGVRAVDDDLLHALAASSDGDGTGGTSTVLVPRALPARRTASRSRRRTIGLAAAGTLAAAVVAWPLLLDGGPERPMQAQAAAGQPSATAATAIPQNLSASGVTATGPAASAVPTGAAAPSGQPAAVPQPGEGGSTGGPGGGITPTDGGPGPGAGTTGGAAPATSPPPAQPPGTRTETYTSEGGTVSAACTATTARLTSWTPSKPYKLEQVSAGPAAQVFAVFRHGNTLVQMTVTCPGGEPTGSTSRSSK